MSTGTWAAVEQGPSQGCPSALCCLTRCACPAHVCVCHTAIMTALLADMGGGQWRVREAASLAMGDLLQVCVFILVLVVISS